MREIILLGSTGSVGRNVLDVVGNYPDRFRVKALATGGNVSEIAKQAERFSPDTIAIADEALLDDLKKISPPGIKVTGGMESIIELSSRESSDILFMAVSGMAALPPLVAALESGKTVALASKEPIVSAGNLINNIVKEKGGIILPVDSEHSAISQCLSGRNTGDIETLYITGTGGPLLGRTKKDMGSVTISEVLDHPKWDMGRKITVDSATLMNKGLEVIEARWLFGVTPDRIKVVIHPEAMVHSMVGFTDGTVTAGIFSPDMRFPILRALAYPDILPGDLPRVDFLKTGTFSFLEPDRNTFPAIDIAYGALEAGGTMPAVLNSSNETAVKLFLENKIRFLDIMRLVENVLSRHKNVEDPTLEDIMESERWAKEEVLASC